MLGKLPVPGRPTTSEDSRAMAYCACSGCGCMDIFSLVYHFFLLSPALWETARYRLKYCLKGPVNPKQPTNQKISLSQKILQQLAHNVLRREGLTYLFLVSGCPLRLARFPYLRSNMVTSL